MADRTTVPRDVDDDGPVEGGPGPDSPAASVWPTGGPSDSIAVPVRSLLWRARIGVAVGVLGLVLAAVFFLGAQNLRREAAVREDVREAGELVALRVIGYTLAWYCFSIGITFYNKWLFMVNTVSLFFFWQPKRATSQRCLLYTSPSPRDRTRSRMPSSA